MKKTGGFYLTLSIVFAYNRFMRSGKKKSRAAIELGRRGGKARAKNMTAEQRSEQARAAVKARWAKQKGKP